VFETIINILSFSVISFLQEIKISNIRVLYKTINREECYGLSINANGFVYGLCCWGTKLANRDEGCGISVEIPE
jgi:hypothetical protein